MQLDLVPIYLAAGRDALQRLIPTLEQTFGVVARVRNPWFDPEQAFDAARGQYCSTTLLAQLLDDPTGGADRVCGVVGADLFLPVLTYVFGEAQLDGRAAVVSTHRLCPENYGLPPDPDLLFERLKVEVVHELGHTWGLLHCPATECAMHASTYVEEIDLKTAWFCAACMRVVRDGTRGQRRATL